MSAVTDEIEAALRQQNAGRLNRADHPQTLAEFLARHGDAAVSVAGAGQTAWNGQVVEASDGVLGLAHWDGTLHLDRECILDPLREMYARTGDHQSDAALIRYREALLTILHEQSHFLGPAGATQDAARLAFKQPGSRSLEEGVAEAWAHARLDDYLVALGIDRVAPGIDRVTADASYQAFVPAVQILATELDQRAGLDPGTSLDQLNRETSEGQWPLVVDLVYSSTELPAVVPPDREPAVRLRLENTFRESFAALALSEPLPRGFAASRSRSVAHHCLSRLDQEIAAAYRHFTSSSETRNRSRPQPHTAPHQAFLPAHRTFAPAHDALTAEHRAFAAAHHAFAGVAPPASPVPRTVATAPSAAVSPGSDHPRSAVSRSGSERGG